jgi:hypothetical protein
VDSDSISRTEGSLDSGPRGKRTREDRVESCCSMASESSPSRSGGKGQSTRQRERLKGQRTSEGKRLSCSRSNGRGTREARRSSCSSSGATRERSRSATPFPSPCSTERRGREREGLNPGFWEFKALVGGLKENVETAAEAGCMLAEILLAEPGWLGEVAKQIVYPPIGDFIPRSKDVRRLPVPADVLDFIRGGLKKQFRRRHGRQTAREKRDTGVLAWIFLVIVNLNANWGGFGNARNALCVAEPSQAQRCTLEHVRRCAVRFVDMVDPESGALCRRDVKDWSERLRSTRVSYKGETLEVAQALTLEETSPALRKGESASSVDVLTVCGPELGKRLADIQARCCCRTMTSTSFLALE